MKEIKLKVDGMMCEGCENRITKCLSILEGVKEVIANYKDGIVILKLEQEIGNDIIKEKIEEIGFEVKED